MLCIAGFLYIKCIRHRPIIVFDAFKNSCVILSVDIRASIDVCLIERGRAELKICDVVFYIRRMKAEIL
jgi:hypothetical protein